MRVDDGLQLTKPLNNMRRPQTVQHDRWCCSTYFEELKGRVR